MILAVSPKLQPKLQNSESLKDKRVEAEVYEHDVDRKVISGKLVLKRLGVVTSQARYVLRGFEEDVRTEDVFASTTLTASVRMLLSFAIGRKSEGCTVFTADVKTAFFNTDMKDGDVVYAEPTLECGALQKVGAKSENVKERAEVAKRNRRAHPQ